MWERCPFFTSKNAKITNHSFVFLALIPPPPLVRLMYLISPYVVKIFSCTSPLLRNQVITPMSAVQRERLLRP